MTTTILSREFIEAFGDDDMTAAEIAEYCVGNSHMWIVTDLSSTTGICACGRQVREIEGEWVHDLGDGRTTGRACPPYDCSDCGRRHNEPITYTLTGMDERGCRVSRTVGAAKLDARILRVTPPDHLTGSSPTPWGSTHPDHDRMIRHLNRPWRTP